MSLVRDRIAALNINTTSPDGSVYANLTNDRGIKVEFERDIADYHDDSSLGDQIEHALAGAAKGYEQATDLIRGGARGRAHDPSPDSPSEKRRRQFDLETSQLEVKGESPRSYATVHWLGADTFVVLIRAGAVARLTVGQLASEVNGAILAASRLRHNEAMAIYKSIYGHDRFAKRKESIT